MVAAVTSSTERPKVAKSPQRSRITNGKLLPGDNRSAWVRRAKDIIAAHISDLGGEANISTAESSIVRRCAVITTELEQLEARFAVAGAADPEALDLYLRGSNSLRRLLESIGLERRARDVSAPTLSEYLRLDDERVRREREIEATAQEPMEATTLLEREVLE